MKNVIRYDIDDVLDLVGLRRSRSLFGIALSAIALVAVGAAGLILVLDHNLGAHMLEVLRNAMMWPDTQLTAWPRWATPVACRTRSGWLTT